MHSRSYFGVAVATPETLPVSSRRKPPKAAVAIALNANVRTEIEGTGGGNGGSDLGLGDEAGLVAHAQLDVGGQQTTGLPVHLDRDRLARHHSSAAALAQAGAVASRLQERLQVRGRAPQSSSQSQETVPS